MLEIKSKLQHSRDPDIALLSFGGLEHEHASPDLEMNRPGAVSWSDVTNLLL